LSLADAIGGFDPNAITILGVKQGSVICDGGAAPSAASGTTDANSQLTALNILLTSSQLAGM